MSSILTVNPDVKIFTISSSAHIGLTELLRELKAIVDQAQNKDFVSVLDNGSGEQNLYSSDLPTISLNKSAMKNTWKVEKTDDGKFLVTGEKIEKFARRTDMNNYASVNRLRDIMKKLGIRAELTTQGAEPDSIIVISGKEFTLVEDW